MILQENGARFCVAGKIFAVGGRVMANKESEYEGLFGTITEIRSGADRETGRYTQRYGRCGRHLCQGTPNVGRRSARPARFPGIAY